MNPFRRLGFALTLVAGIALPAAAQNAITAQSIMASLKTGSYALSETRIYKFNPDEAKAYFSNQFTGTVVLTGTQGPKQSSIPAAPAAPAPDWSVVTANGNGVGQGLAQEEKCLFLDGLALYGTTYTQTASVKVLKTTYTWTYTYSVEPVAVPEPFTAWDLFQDTSDGGTANVTIDADIAGESLVISKQFQNQPKYSFSLLAPDPLDPALTVSRVTDLKVTVDGVEYPATSTVILNAPGAKAGDFGALDFTYFGNAGVNGNATAQLSLVNGDARTILNSDIFAGNNDGGATGEALALARMATLTVALAAGDHTVVLTGIVKGNSAVADLPISVTNTVHIVTPGCGHNSN